MTSFETAEHIWLPASTEAGCNRLEQVVFLKPLCHFLTTCVRFLEFLRLVFFLFQSVQSSFGCQLLKKPTRYELSLCQKKSKAKIR